MGPLTEEQHELFLKNPRFLGMKFPEIVNPETLEKRYLGKISKLAIGFLKELLALDPKQRIDSMAALNHPWFEDLR